ncbi:MAG: hypothetical protein VB070_04565 [Clostridiaceae bacterium]|nr:hypothetical protein [Clostridiaceae bacterium]
MKKPQLFVFFILILSTLLLSSCSGAVDRLNSLLPDSWRSFGQGQANNGMLSDYELIQKTADAISSKSDIASTYDSIPAKQLDGLSQDQFQQYIEFLRRGISGELASFSQMSDAEETEIKEEILARLPEQKTLVANLQGFWLYYQESGRDEAKFGVFIQSSKDQPAGISKEWVERILDLQDLSSLYFDAIDQSDTAALAVLLKPQALSQDILNLRAQRIIDFYQNNISSRSSDFKLTYARMDGIGFDELGITNPDQSQSVSRSIELVGQPDRSCRIIDVIPDVINTADFQVYYTDKYLMQIGQYIKDEPVQIKSRDLESIIGAPLLHDDTTCTTAANGTQRLILSYQSLDLKAVGSCFRHSRWNGQIIDIKIHDQACHIGSGLRPGQTVEDILSVYPFANETGYIVRGNTDAGAVQLHFTIEQDVISAIELTLLDS